MRLHSSVLSLAAAVALTACAQPAAQDTAEQPDTSAADAEALRAQVDGFVSAWNVADYTTLGALVAEDGILMQPDGPVYEGREAILAVMAEGYDVTTMQQSAVVDEVLLIGDHAYARGSWNIDPAPEAGPDVPSMDGKWSAVYKRGPDGGWQIWRWMWNQPPEQLLAAQ